jgi:hypothetical protein
MPSANDVEQIPRIESIENSERDLKEECSKCHGRRIIPAEKVILRAPCDACGGEGRMYWVDMAMKKKSPSYNHDVSKNCVLENVQFLIALLRDQAGLMGCQVQVDIKPMDYGSHTHSISSIPEYFDANMYIKKMGGF